ncbi:MAG: ATP-binding protein [Cyclobacteriaceae bacterium]
MIDQTEHEDIYCDEELSGNAVVIRNELAWLLEVLHVRLALYFNHETKYNSIYDLQSPRLDGKDFPYARFVLKHSLDFHERLLLCLGMVPHIKPEILDILLSKNKDYDRRFSEFGGVLLEGHTGLIPTVETAVFLLAGDDLERKLHFQTVLGGDFILKKLGVIDPVPGKADMPINSPLWMVAGEYTGLLISGKPYQASFSAGFPAHQIHSQLQWEDLVVAKSTARSLQEIKDWIKHEKRIMKDYEMDKRLKPGYKSLFYGPPGTGKTMSAALLGKSTGRPVFRVDISMVVSKYIGETEKNLARVFDQAQKHDWILFFDEADSLFGKRTQVSSANDRYGNQEIGYLLQRIEDFDGIVLLATNLIDNIDEAFSRRFQSMIEFRMPGVEEKYKLWSQSFSKQVPLDNEIDLWQLAEKFDISGGLMMNVVRRCTLNAITQNKKNITYQNLELAIRIELQKEGILLS